MIACLKKNRGIYRHLCFDGLDVSQAVLKSEFAIATNGFFGLLDSSTQLLSYT